MADAIARADGDLVHRLPAGFVSQRIAGSESRGISGASEVAVTPAGGVTARARSPEANPCWSPVVVPDAHPRAISQECSAGPSRQACGPGAPGDVGQAGAAAGAAGARVFRLPLKKRRVAAVREVRTGNGRRRGDCEHEYDHRPNCEAAHDPTITATGPGALPLPPQSGSGA